MASNIHITHMQMDVKTFLTAALQYTRDMQIDYEECELSIQNLCDNILPLKKDRLVIGHIRATAAGNLIFEPVQQEVEETYSVLVHA